MIRGQQRDRVLHADLAASKIDEVLAGTQQGDVGVPTSDGRRLIMNEVQLHRVVAMTVLVTAVEVTQQPGAHARGDVDPQGAACGMDGSLGRAIDCLQCFAGLDEEDLACRGEVDASTCPFEQRDAQVPSDPGDALVLANILRTDMHAHRPLPEDSDLGRAIAVLARAQQDSLWNRQQLANQLRSLLREYYPAALDAFATWANSLCRPEARELLRAAPTLARAARLTRTQLQAALKRASRQRGIEAEADRNVFRAEWAHQPPLVEDALGKQMLALLVQLEAACAAADQLAEAVEEAFPQHPDAEILLSFPGLGIQLAARILAEIGDDRTRFADARGLKAYAGSSPVTRASGKKSSITRRWVKNDRLNHAGYLWAFSSLRNSPRANAHYRRRREHGDWHAAAQRKLFNRMIGQLYHCIQHRTLFDEDTAFPTPVELAVSAA